MGAGHTTENLRKDLLKFWDKNNLGWGTESPAMGSNI